MDTSFTSLRVGAIQISDSARQLLWDLKNHLEKKRQQQLRRLANANSKNKRRGKAHTVLQKRKAGLGRGAGQGRRFKHRKKAGRRHTRSSSKKGQAARCLG